MTATVALIPARSGSKRIKDKNIRPINGHPLIAYTIRSAIDSEQFDKVVVVTDSEEYARVAERYGAEVPLLRPKEIAGDKSADIEWLSWIFKYFTDSNQLFSVFSVLRPTSPLRTSQTIRRAFAEFNARPEADSLRAVEPCSQHPGKMWILKQDCMYPLLPFSRNDVPWHSNQYSALPEVFVQNACLEIARTSKTLEKSSLAGDVIIPFITNRDEGFDINHPVDWQYLEEIVKRSDLDADTRHHLRGFDLA